MKLWKPTAHSDSRRYDWDLTEARQEISHSQAAPSQTTGKYFPATYKKNISSASICDLEWKDG